MIIFLEKRVESIDRSVRLIVDRITGGAFTTLPYLYGKEPSPAAFFEAPNPAFTLMLGSGYTRVIKSPLIQE